MKCQCRMTCQYKMTSQDDMPVYCTNTHDMLICVLLLLSTLGQHVRAWAREQTHDKPKADFLILCHMRFTQQHGMPCSGHAELAGCMQYLLQRYCPLMASIAASEASNPSKLTKPKPLLAPVSGSRMIFGVAMTIPNALKVSYNSCNGDQQASASFQQQNRVKEQNKVNRGCNMTCARWELSTTCMAAEVQCDAQCCGQAKQCEWKVMSCWSHSPSICCIPSRQRLDPDCQ